MLEGCSPLVLTIEVAMQGGSQSGQSDREKRIQERVQNHLFLLDALCLEPRLSVLLCQPGHDKRMNASGNWCSCMCR